MQRQPVRLVAFIQNHDKALLHWLGFFSMEVTSMFYAVHGFAQYVLKKESGFINIRMIQES